MTGRRGLFDHVADYLAVPAHDAVIAKSLGLVAGAALWLLYIGHRISNH
ncbi:hypothetical protein [Janibacter terrae]